jgi:hypothetical protein
MAENRWLTLEQVGGEAFQAWLGEGNGTRTAVLSALLDVHLLFREECLSPEALLPLFEAWWPGASLDEVWEEPHRYGLVQAVPEAILAVPEELRRPLAAALERHLWDRPLDLPGGTVSFRRLVSSFVGYCQTELRAAPEEDSTDIWGGVAFQFSNRRQLLLVRPRPLMLRAHPEWHTLALCSLPEASRRAVAESFTHQPALRHRLALFDVEAGEKVNLTRGELPVYFERYLRHAYGLRMAPLPGLTESLRDGALLNLDKG